MDQTKENNPSENIIIIPDNIIEQLKFHVKNHDMAMMVVCNEDINLTLIGRRELPFHQVALYAIQSLINALTSSEMYESNEQALQQELEEEAKQVKPN